MVPSRPILFVVLTLSSCKTGHEAEGTRERRAVRCAPVQTAMVKATIELRGTVSPLPDRDAQVAPQVSGRILRVEVHEGDPVTSGQLLARLDDAPLADAAKQAEAGLSRARAERENAQTTLGRIQRVFERGIAPKQELDDAIAKEASAKAAEAEAEAVLRQAQRQIDRAAVRSPLKGVVLAVLKKPGELVDGTPATPVVEVADTSEIELVTDAPAQDLMVVTLGAPAVVSFPALSMPKCKGSVSRVSPTVDRLTGTGTVRVRIDTAGGVRPPIGALGTVEIACGEAHLAALVPVASLRNVISAEGEVVLCGADNLAHVKKVLPVRTREDQVEVQGEITANDRVAVEPVLGLSDGDPIEAQP
jgi:RND family efflux transporter MFP subunit